MEALQYNPQDPYFKGSGAVEDILKDPRVTLLNVAPPGSTFNPAFDQKNWAYPPGTGRVKAFQLDVTDDVPTLIPYLITEAISSVYNLTTNANTQGIVPFMPVPLIPLSGKQGIVKVHIAAGIIQLDEWWVVQDITLTPAAPASSPTGGSFSDADRATLNGISALLGKVAKTLGL